MTFLMFDFEYFANYCAIEFGFKLILSKLSDKKRIAAVGHSNHVDARRFDITITMWAKAAM